MSLVQGVQNAIHELEETTQGPKFKVNNQLGYQDETSGDVEIIPHVQQTRMGGEQMISPSRSDFDRMYELLVGMNQKLMLQISRLMILRRELTVSKRKLMPYFSRP